MYVFGRATFAGDPREHQHALLDHGQMHLLGAAAMLVLQVIDLLYRRGDGLEGRGVDSDLVARALQVGLLGARGEQEEVALALEASLELESLLLDGAAELPCSIDKLLDASRKQRVKLFYRLGDLLLWWSRRWGRRRCDGALRRLGSAGARSGGGRRGALLGLRALGELGGRSCYVFQPRGCRFQSGVLLALPKSCELPRKLTPTDEGIEWADEPLDKRGEIMHAVGRHPAVLV